MEGGPVLPSRSVERVDFQISAEAAAVIRRRGGKLWIWPSPARWPYATTEPPGEERDWTVYDQGDLVVRLDTAIVPPQHWAVALAQNESRLLDARWNGLDPSGVFGRLPLVDSPGAEPPGSGDSVGNRVLAAYGAVVAVLWVLQIADVESRWIALVRWGALAALLLAVIAVAGLRRARRSRGARTEPE
jgi:hypothetical protein